MQERVVRKTGKNRIQAICLNFNTRGVDVDVETNRNVALADTKYVVSAEEFVYDLSPADRTDEYFARIIITINSVAYNITGQSRKKM